MELPEAIRKGCEITKPMAFSWFEIRGENAFACALGGAAEAEGLRDQYKYVNVYAMQIRWPILLTVLSKAKNEDESDETLLDWIVERSDLLVLKWKDDDEQGPDPRLAVADELEEKLKELEGQS